jgi:hypothetical protein
MRLFARRDYDWAMRCPAHQVYPLQRPPSIALGESP